MRRLRLVRKHCTNFRCKDWNVFFQAAALNGAEVLILGAFGCGAFCNPPRIVARAFRSVQEKYASYFETIEYAVFCGKNDTQNNDVFNMVLGDRK